jgi:hypothetical protein
VVVCVLVLAIGAAALYLLGPGRAPVPPQAATVPSDSTRVPPAPPESAVAYPVEKIAAAAVADAGQAPAPLPALDDSDNVARDVIGAIVNRDDFVSLLTPTGIVRRIVATVDNLPRATLAPQISAVRPVPGSFATAGTAGAITIAAANAERYAVYVKAAESIDVQRLVGFYVRLYPLFQQAYVELGYPGGYFNDRLIDVVDHLLAAPEPESPVHLVQPRVRYQFADPGLEAMSAGQKILVRIGIDNERRLKAKLREVRGALTAGVKRP